MGNPSAQKLTSSRKSVWAVLLCCILACVAGAVAWHNGLKDQLVAKNFGMVEPGLYRSGQISARMIEPTLKSNGIREIISLSASGAKPGDVAGEDRAAADLGIDRLTFPLSGDGTGSIEMYADAVAAIARARAERKPVLVHCVAGAQRTGGVIAVYQLLVEHQTPEQAFAEMRRFGHDPSDNPKLLEYLNAHMSELAQRLVDKGVIAQLPEAIPVVRAE